MIPKQVLRIKGSMREYSKMVRYSDIEEFEIHNPRLVGSILVCGCLWVAGLTLLHWITSVNE